MHNGQVVPMVSFCLFDPLALQTDIETVVILQEFQEKPDKEWQRLAKQILCDHIAKEVHLTLEATRTMVKGEVLNIPYSASFITIQTLMLERRELLDEHRDN
ncbi:MAG: hypothetical protein F6K48_14280 [Okeania sp. SIO3H1]|nr:hypothetical protein [Okeania sp. SIO3H1]NET24972.1 hypothetical protein [Okeania sp. SIO1I7]